MYVYFVFFLDCIQMLYVIISGYRVVESSVRVFVVARLYNTAFCIWSFVVRHIEVASLRNL